MVPKMEACLRAVDEGVPQARVIDGRIAGALVQSMSQADMGTLVTKGAP